MMENDDFVRSLGPSFLAHRLLRASELIVEGTSDFIRRNGFVAPARSGSTLLLLEDQGPLSITEIAYRLRLSHPMIIKLTDRLIGAGLADDQFDPQDGRRRLIHLTNAGVAQARLLAELLRVIQRTFAEIFDETRADLYDAAERFEAAVERLPLGSRLERQAEMEKAE